MYEVIRYYRQIESISTVASLPWWLTGSTVDLSFFEGRYYDGTSTLTSPTSLITTSRASTGYATNADGTLTSFASNTPRIGLGTGLLVEEARTNICGFSTNLSANQQIVLTGLSATVTAPDGTLTSAYDLPANGVGDNGWKQSFATVNATVYTYSIFAKNGTFGNNWVEITSATNGADTLRSWFNLATGAVGTLGHTSSSITPYVNGWYRLTVTFTSAGTGGDFYASPRIGDGSTTSPTGDGVNITMFAYGSQVEAGAFPMSYIPTTTIAVTRAQDVVTLTGAGLAVLQSNHTAVAQFNRPNIAYGPIFEATDGTNNNRIDLGAINQFTYFTLIAAGVLQFDGAGPGFVLSTPQKTGYSINSTLYSAAAVGTLFQASIAGALPTITTGYLGDDIFGRSANCYIPRLTLWNSRLPDATLQGFTA